MNITLGILYLMTGLYQIICSLSHIFLGYLNSSILIFSFFKSIIFKSLAIKGFNSGYPKSESGKDLISVIYSEKFFFVFKYSVPYILHVLNKFLFSTYSFSVFNL